MPPSISGPSLPSLRVRSRAARVARVVGSMASLVLLGAALSACAGSPTTSEEDAIAASPDMTENAPPAAIQAWMDRLTIAHHYDPATGFIVADEVVPLPSVISRAPDIRTLIAFGADNNVPVVVFATADRCAPCQQYKRDALNDPEVLVALESGRVFATHIEVDQDAATATELLGGRSIPVTYLFRNGEIVDRMSGQRSAADLLAWLEAAGA